VKGGGSRLGSQVGQRAQEDVVGLGDKDVAGEDKGRGGRGKEKEKKRKEININI